MVSVIYFCPCVQNNKLDEGRISFDSLFQKVQLTVLHPM